MNALRRVPHQALAPLAEAIEGGRLQPPYTATSLAQYLPRGAAPAVARALQALSSDGVAPRHAAAMLRLLAEERSAGQAMADRIELVWTGPEAPGSVTRDTRVVAQELFREARRSLLISSYNIDTGERAEDLFGALAHRLDSEPGLEVRLFLNVKREGPPDSRTDAEVLRAFAERFRNRVWPGQRLPRVFYFPPALARDGDRLAFLHAKVIVADGSRALITSANLSRTGHQRSLEAGVLVADPQLARALGSQFEALLVRGVLQALPGL